MSHHKQTRHIVDSKVGCCLPSHVLKKPFALLCLEPCLLLTQQCQAGYRWGRETFYPHTTHIQGYRVGWLWWQEYLKVKTMSASASRCFYAGKNSQLKCHTFMMTHIHDVTHPWCDNSHARRLYQILSSEKKEPLPWEWKCPWWKGMEIQQCGILPAHRVVALPPGMIAEAFWLQLRFIFVLACVRI